MWDLDSIIRQNNQVAIDYMMRGQEVDVAQSPQPRAWSLALLADKLRIGPPLLSELLNCFTNFDTLEKFLGLIRQFLPEHEEEILSEPGGRRVYRFCYLFGKRYFPLPPYTAEANVEQLVSGLPVELMAMSYSAYHELEMRRGYLLLLSLVVYPYEGDERDLDETFEERTPFGDPLPRPKGKTLLEVFTGGRVPLLDAVQRIVGADLAGLIPGDGWTADELHLMTDGTPHDGVGHFADWACSETGCVILDSSYDDCAFMEGMGEPIFKWTKYNVDTLTEQWPKVQEIRQEIDRMVEWLEADPISRFGELLEFLTAKATSKRKKTAKAGGKHFYDPTEHWCPLDQQGENEEEDDNGEDAGASSVAEGDIRLRRATADDIPALTQF